MNGGRLEGGGYGLVNEGTLAEIHGGTIQGNICGLAAHQETHVHDGSISGLGAAVIVWASFSMYDGELFGTDAVLVLASDGARPILYNGELNVLVETNPEVRFNPGIDAELIYYTALSWGEEIAHEVTQTRIRKRISFEVITPELVELVPGTPVTIPFAVKGQKAIGGSLIDMEDMLGTSGGVHLGEMNAVAYTVSGNSLTFSPEATGSGVLTIDDTLTYNGTTEIPVTVALAATPTPTPK
jgi:hypothetical protein